MSNRRQPPTRRGSPQTRLLPHDPEAEAAVIGASLQDPKALEEAAAIVGPGDFCLEKHRLSFEAMNTLRARGDTADLLTVTHELRKGGRLDRVVGGPVTLAALVDAVPTVANVAYYARIVKAHARRRAVWEACARGADRALVNGHGPEEPLETIVADVEAVLLTVQEPDPQAAAPLSVGAEEFLSGKIQPVEWAVEKIWPAEASGIIGGPEKAGKSWLADELALSLSTGTPFLGKYRVPRPRRVLRWEEEDSATRTHRRDSQLLAGRRRPMPRSELLRYLVGHGLKLDRPEGLARLRSELEMFRPEVVIVGNLREIHSRDENRPEMAEVRDALRALSRDYGAALVIIHHFRKVQEGQSRRGTQMLAGSGVMGAWVEAWMWVTPGESEDIALLEVGSKDAPGIGRLVVQRRDLTDMEPLAEDEEGGKVWPVILAEIEPKGKAEENRDKIRKVVEEIHVATDAPVTIEAIMEKVKFKERTVREHIRTIVLGGAWQEADLPGGRKGYVPAPAQAGG